MDTSRNSRHLTAEFEGKPYIEAENIYSEQALDTKEGKPTERNKKADPVIHDGSRYRVSSENSQKFEKGQQQKQPDADLRIISQQSEPNAKMQNGAHSSMYSSAQASNYSAGHTVEQFQTPQVPMQHLSDTVSQQQMNIQSQEQTPSAAQQLRHHTGASTNSRSSKKVRASQKYKDHIRDREIEQFNEEEVEEEQIYQIEQQREFNEYADYPPQFVAEPVPIQAPELIPEVQQEDDTLGEEGIPKEEALGNPEPVLEVDEEDGQQLDEASPTEAVETMKVHPELEEAIEEEKEEQTAPPQFENPYEEQAMSPPEEPMAFYNPTFAAQTDEDEHQKLVPINDIEEVNENLQDLNQQASFDAIQEAEIDDPVKLQELKQSLKDDQDSLSLGGGKMVNPSQPGEEEAKFHQFNINTQSSNLENREDYVQEVAPPLPVKGRIKSAGTGAFPPSSHLNIQAPNERMFRKRYGAPFQEQVNSQGDAPLWKPNQQQDLFKTTVPRKYKSSAKHSSAFGGASSTKLSTQNKVRLSQNLQSQHQRARPSTKWSMQQESLHNGVSLKKLNKHRLMSAVHNYGGSRYKNSSILKPLDRKARKLQPGLKISEGQLMPFDLHLPHKAFQQGSVDLNKQPHGLQSEFQPGTSSNFFNKETPGHQMGGDLFKPFKASPSSIRTHMKSEQKHRSHNRYAFTASTNLRHKRSSQGRVSQQQQVLLGHKESLVSAQSNGSQRERPQFATIQAQSLAGLDQVKKGRKQLRLEKMIEDCVYTNPNYDYKKHTYLYNMKNSYPGMIEHGGSVGSQSPRTIRNDRASIKSKSPSPEAVEDRVKRVAFKIRKCRASRAKKQADAIAKSQTAFGAMAIVFDVQNGKEKILLHMARSRFQAMETKLKMYDTCLEVSGDFMKILKHQKKLIRNKIRYQNRLAQAAYIFKPQEKQSFNELVDNFNENSVSVERKMEDQDIIGGSGPTSSHTINPYQNEMVLSEPNGEGEQPIQTKYNSTQINSAVTRQNQPQAFREYGLDQKVEGQQSPPQLTHNGSKHSLVSKSPYLTQQLQPPANMLGTDRNSTQMAPELQSTASNLAGSRRALQGASQKPIQVSNVQVKSFDMLEQELDLVTAEYNQLLEVLNVKNTNQHRLANHQYARKVAQIEEETRQWDSSVEKQLLAQTFDLERKWRQEFSLNDTLDSHFDDDSRGNPKAFEMSKPVSRIQEELKSPEPVDNPRSPIDPVDHNDYSRTTSPPKLVSQSPQRQAMIAQLEAEIFEMEQRLISRTQGVLQSDQVQKQIKILKANIH